MFTPLGTLVRQQETARQDHEWYVIRHPEVFLEDMPDTDLMDFALRVCLVALNSAKSNKEAGEEIRAIVNREIDFYMQSVDLS